MKKVVLMCAAFAAIASSCSSSDDDGSNPIVPSTETQHILDATSYTLT